MIFVRLPKPLLVATLLIAALAPAAGSAEALPIRKTHATMVLDAVDKFLLPRIQALQQTTGALEAAVGAVCREGEPALTAARAAFGDTVRAWGGLDFVRFGPSAREHRLERIFFWPDPRAFASRQLKQLLAARKPDLLAPGALSSQSVAVQGLTALEVLLFDDKAPLGAGKDEAGTYRCALAAAIAANIHAVAGEIAAGWVGGDGFRTKILAPGSDNALYKDAGETVREVMKALVAGIELCRDRFILPELTAVTANPPPPSMTLVSPNWLPQPPAAARAPRIRGVGPPGGLSQVLSRRAEGALRGDRPRRLRSPRQALDDELPADVMEQSSRRRGPPR